MIDLHCHILPGVDDGAGSIEETISLLKMAEEAGFDTICVTPHYAEPMYLNTKKKNTEVLKYLKEVIEVEKIPIQLYLGNEIFIQENMDNLLETEQITTLAGSKYVLIELPMYQELPQEVVQKMLEPVRKKGFQIVIAHPERYTYIQQNPEKIFEYFEEDVIFQGNYASILGAYGKEAQKTIKKLLTEKVIHYLASDVHHINRCFYQEFDEIQKRLLKIVDSEYFERLTEINPKRVIENQEIVKFEKNKVKILMGTKNPGKIEGARQAFSKYFGKVEIQGIEVESDVGAQPVNEEIMQGAKNRVSNLKKYAQENQINADFYIASEAGITNLLGEWLDFNIAVIEDFYGNQSVGSSAGFPIPEKYVDEIIETELGKVMDKLFHGSGLNKQNGGIGRLTRDEISRIDLTQQGFIMALVKFLNGEVWK